MEYDYTEEAMKEIKQTEQPELSSPIISKPVDTRPWWKKRTNIGGIIFTVGSTMAFFSGEPVIGGITIPITAIGFILTQVGGALAGYGWGFRQGKIINTNQQK